MAYFNVDYRQSGFVDTSLKSAPKRIIICCDGTWQSSVTNTENIPSNVTRIARYLTKVGRDTKDANEKQWQQLVYYDAGIGTGVSDMEAKRQGGTGSGFVGNVIEAYNFIVLNYNPGDQIFCIGFSRGAYTARAVAGLVTDIGIVRSRDMQDFPELYRTYQAHTNSHTFRKSPAWREWVEGKRAFDPNQKNVPPEWRQAPFAWEKRPHGCAPESTRWVEAVGVFDTVGSLGIPEIEGIVGTVVGWLGKKVPVEEFGFHNVALSPYIKHAYHALAIDERRKPFNATLWHLPADGVATPIKALAPSSTLREKWEKLRDTDGATESQLAEAWENLVDAEMAEELKGHISKLLQVWFPGVHINIGGGSDDVLKQKEGDFEQISTITLFWMLEQLRGHLSFEINVEGLACTDRFLMLKPFVEKLFRDPKQVNNWLVKRVNNLLAKEPKEDPWHDGNKTRKLNLTMDVLKGWATGPINDDFENSSTSMKRLGSEYRTPGEYKESKLQNGQPVKLGQTREEIHPSVRFRMEQCPDYKPVPLKDFTRERKVEGNTVRYEWVKKNVRIKEYKIDGENQIERGHVSWGLPEVRAFLGRLDKEYGVDSWLAKALDAPEPVSAPTQHGFQPPTES